MCTDTEEIAAGMDVYLRHNPGDARFFRVKLDENRHPNPETSRKQPKTTSRSESTSTRRSREMANVRLGRPRTVRKVGYGLEAPLYLRGALGSHPVGHALSNGQRRSRKQRRSNRRQRPDQGVCGAGGI